MNVNGNAKNSSNRIRPPRAVLICKTSNTIILILLAVYFFIAPGFIISHNLADPALKGPGIPKIVWHTHQKLTPKFERWARSRIASGIAARLNLHDVPGTEWPLFGSVYYLWTTELLQKAWEQDHTLAPQAPREYARKTIEAATDLIMDPAHHTWVRQHWGEDYMHTQNVFFRFLIMAGITSHQNLIHDGRHLDILRDQADTLAAALDTSPHGVLEDYPGECYPIDVFAAIAGIKKADTVLVADHSAFINRAMRGFNGRMLDPYGLVPYLMDPLSGEIYGNSRGIGNSYVLIFAPGLYPEKAGPWYRAYEKIFWQERMTAAGFREFPEDASTQDTPNKGWGFDVDAGPIMAGFSPAANAYGVAAARVNGRFDHAYVLGAQVLTATWPLPDGTLLGPRLLSSFGHAPYLGEVNLIYLLAQQPAPGVPIKTGGKLPGFVWIGIALYFATGILIALIALRDQYMWNRSAYTVPLPRLQASIWVFLLSASIIALALDQGMVAVTTCLAAQMFPKKANA